jgi:hypothetical protein
MARNCPDCGAALAPEDRVCPGCGGGAAPSVAGQGSLQRTDIAQPRNLARIAQIVALVGFVLPWITVSCQGRVLAQVSGLDMALGRATIRNPFTGVSHAHGGSPNATIVFALVFILAGLVVSFNLSVVRVALANMIACGTSLLLIGYEVLVSASSAIRSETASPQAAENGLERGLADAVKVGTGFGFWLTCAALAAAIYFYWKIHRGAAGGAAAAAGPVAPPAPQVRTNGPAGESPPLP